MSLSGNARHYLELGLANPDAAREIANQIDSGAPLSGNNTFSGHNIHTGEEDFKRLTLNQGTALGSGNWALSAGFGSDSAHLPSISVAAGSTDSRGSATITASSTTPGLAAKPTATLTFADGSFATPPVALITGGTGGNQDSVPFTVATTSTTLVATLQGTPNASDKFIINWAVLG